MHNNAAITSAVHEAIYDGSRRIIRGRELLGVRTGGTNRGVRILFFYWARTVPVGFRNKFQGVAPSSIERLAA